MSAATLKKSPARTNRERAKARSRISDARKALLEPASVIAARARAQYAKADQPLRAPSKKPRLVKTQVKKDNSFVWVMRFFGVGIIASIFIVVTIQTSIAERQIRIDAIRNQQRQEIVKFEKARNEVAELKSPERITRRANYLGLQQPSRFISVSIPMEVAPRTDQKDDELWREVKAIINATS